MKEQEHNVWEEFTFSIVCLFLYLLLLTQNKVCTVQQGFLDDFLRFHKSYL